MNTSIGRMTMGRPLRKKVAGQGAYYHLYNRVGGPIGELPFTDVDKEKAFQMLEDLSELFLLELISVAWLGNHFLCEASHNT